MTRKDYIELADALRAVRPLDYTKQQMLLAQWQETCNAIAGVLARDNPRFDMLRFGERCGM